MVSSVPASDLSGSSSQLQTEVVMHYEHTKSMVGRLFMLEVSGEGCHGTSQEIEGVLGVRRCQEATAPEYSMTVSPDLTRRNALVGRLPKLKIVLKVASAATIVDMFLVSARHIRHEQRTSVRVMEGEYGASSANQG